MEEVVQVIINNGLALGVCIYFLMKDWKQSSERIYADKQLAESLTKQSEILRQLNETVTALKDVINRKVD